MVVALGLAWLTYKLVEKPVRFAWKNEKIKLSVLLILMAITGVAGLFTYKKDGFAFRHGKLERMHAQLSFGPWLGIPNHASIMIMGDSHGGHLGPGLMKSELGSSIANYCKASCLPFYGIDTYSSYQTPGDCKKHMASAWEVLERDPFVKVVVIANRGSMYLTPWQTLVLESKPELTDRVEIYKIGMRNTLKRLLAKNKKVIFVIDNTELDFDPHVCIARPLRFWQKIKHPCSVARASFEQKASVYRQLVMEVLQDFPQVIVLDLAQKMCDEKQCWVIRDERMFYADNNHLSEDGATYIAQFLVPLLRKSLQEANH